MYVITKINLQNLEFISNMYNSHEGAYDLLIDSITDYCFIYYGLILQLDSNLEDTIYQINNDAYLQVKIKDVEETYIILYHKTKRRGFLFNTYNYTPVYIFHLKYMSNGSSVTTLENVICI